MLYNIVAHITNIMSYIITSHITYMNNDLIKYDVFYWKWTYLVWYFVLFDINHVKSYHLYYIICSLIYCHIIQYGHIINHFKLSHIKYCPIISNIFISYSVEMVWNVKYFLQLRLVKLCLSSFTQTGFPHQTIIKTSLFHTVLEINPSQIGFILSGRKLGQTISPICPQEGTAGPSLSLLLYEDGNIPRGGRICRSDASSPSRLVSISNLLLKSLLVFRWVHY